LPFIKAQLSLSANFLQTNYIDSKVFGIRMSKDFMKGKLNGDLYFRYGEYHYKANENTNRQEIIGASLSYRLMKKLSLYLYYEGTFDNIGYDYNRLNTKLIQRF
jgi:3'-phosphoadenosine 5'-phosphosulfate sulfotransferase